MRDCKDCTISVACNQFRCRDLYNSTINLFVSNNPCIESSDGLRIAPYNLAYPLLDKQAASAGLNIAENHWELVHDFTEKPGGLNYSIVDPSQWKVEKVPVEGLNE